MDSLEVYPLPTPKKIMCRAPNEREKFIKDLYIKVKQVIERRMKKNIKVVLIEKKKTCYLLT